MKKPETSNAQVWLYARKKGEENFQQTTFVGYEFEVYTYLFDVVDSVIDRIFNNKTICNVL